MMAFDFLNEDICSQNKIYDELEEVFMTSAKGYVSKRKFNLICKNNLKEDIYKLFKDWVSTTRFESMLTPFIYS